MLQLQALRQADKTWSEAATAKDLNRYIDFYDDDISLIDPNGQIYRGIENLTQIVASGFGTPGYFLTWDVENAFVAKAGDLGYTKGSWDKQITSENGQLVKTHGCYIELSGKNRLMALGRQLWMASGKLNNNNNPRISL